MEEGKENGLVLGIRNSVSTSDLSLCAPAAVLWWCLVVSSWAVAWGIPRGRKKEAAAATEWRAAGYRSLTTKTSQDDGMLLVLMEGKGRWVR